MALWYNDQNLNISFHMFKLFICLRNETSKTILEESKYLIILFPNFTNFVFEIYCLDLGDCINNAQVQLKIGYYSHLIAFGKTYKTQSMKLPELCNKYHKICELIMMTVTLQEENFFFIARVSIGFELYITYVHLLCIVENKLCLKNVCTSCQNIYCSVQKCYGKPFSLQAHFRMRKLPKSF